MKQIDNFKNSNFKSSFQRCIFLILVALVSHTFCRAQSEYPFVFIQGTKWLYIIQDDQYPCYHVYRLDKVISTEDRDGKHYATVQTDYYGGSDCTPYTTDYCEYDSYVCKLYKNNDEALICDFGAKINEILSDYDTVVGEYYWDNYEELYGVPNTPRIVKIQSKESTMFAYAEGIKYWIEGIGCSKSHGEPYFDLKGPFPMCSTPSIYTEEKTKLLYCVRDGKYVFRLQDFEEFLEGKDGIDILNSEESDESTQLYDLFGRPVDKPFKGHIYIQGNKKIVWRN